MCLFLCSAPLVSHAAIIINEVAWMGGLASASDEWIELYNSGGSSVDVEGWVLSDGMNFDVVLTGSIASGQYAVLERTDDASAAGNAFLIYSGSLVNTGATLSLYRADASLEDRAAGGADWVSIGGDNVTKETAQYTTGGWMTAVATPGASNELSEIPDDDEEKIVIELDVSEPTSSSTSKSSSDHSSSISTLLYTTPRPLHVSIHVPERAYVHQEVHVNASGSGLSDVILDSLSYDWNFGDFNTAQGKEATHRFEYPGEYVVTVHSHFKTYDAYDRKTITVLPVSFSITTNSSGDVQVHNDAPYEVDISGYRIVAEITLTFPEGTILLPNATITLPREKLRYLDSAMLFDDMATVVASTVSQKKTVLRKDLASEVTKPVVTQMAYIPAPAPAPVPVIPSEPAQFIFTEHVPNIIESSTSSHSQEVFSSEGLQIAAPIEATKEIPSEKLAYFALLAVIGLGVAAVFAGKVRG